MNIVTPSFRLELTPVAGTAQAPEGARPEAGTPTPSDSLARDVLDEAAGAVVAVALGRAAAAPGGTTDASDAGDAGPRSEGGWVRVRVRAGICGFRADYEARTQSASLRRFERELGQLQEATTGTGRAELACDEPGIDLRLERQGAAAITGHFALESERRGGAWTTLSGTFELEPQGLFAIRASIVELLGALER